MDAQELLAIAKRRGFLYPSAEAYGRMAGFYDYGPLGARLKENLLDLWRGYFVLGEGFAEIDCASISPEAVFKASGHLEEFTDFAVECSKCGEGFRADHLLEGKVDNPDTLGKEELAKELKANKVKCPTCGGGLGEPEPVNLMFKTSVGPGKGRDGYLRPETAQGIFTNFPNLYRFNRGCWHGWFRL